MLKKIEYFFFFSRKKKGNTKKKRKKAHDSTMNSHGHISKQILDHNVSFFFFRTIFF